MSVVLKNVSKKMQIHDLPHDVVCEGEGDGCLCTDDTIKVLVLNPETGGKSFRHVDKTINDSIHIAVGEKSRELPDNVVKVRSIAAAIKANEIKAEKASTAAPAPAPAPAPALAPVAEEASEAEHVSA